MRQSEAKKIVAVLKATYPRQEFDQQNFDAYVTAILDLDYELANAAAAVTIHGSRFLPTPAELRATYAVLKLGAPEPLHAWAQAISPPPRHELVARARRLVGDDWTWRNEPEWSHRKPFLDAYGEVLRKAIREIAQPELAAAEHRALEPAPRPAELPPADAGGELVAMSDEVRRQIEAAIGQPIQGEHDA